MWKMKLVYAVSITGINTCIVGYEQSYSVEIPVLHIFSTRA